MTPAAVIASDGEIGAVEQFYFDDDRWTIRWLVVRAGGWWTGASVLVSPIAVRRFDAGGRYFELSLSRAQIRAAPLAETEEPVSRRKEREFFDYYQWPYYWAGTALWGAAALPSGLVPQAIPSRALRESPVDQGLREPETVTHLRSSSELRGYSVHSLDRRFGKLHDFIADDSSWSIRYLVIHTRRGNLGRPVLVSPDWVRSVSWDNHEIVVDHSFNEISHSPAFDPHLPINRDYEQRLCDYYGRPAYWPEELYRRIF